MPTLPSLNISKSQLSLKDLSIYGKQMAAESKAFISATQTGYDDNRCSINLPFDKELSRKTSALAIRHAKADAIVVVGIGGSNLGTIAVQEAVLGRYHNQIGGKPLVLFADTVDAKSMSAIISILTKLLKSGKTVMINGISKSGATTETTANFEILIGLLKRYDTSHADHVVVTSDEGSAFWRLADKKGYHRLLIPKKVGGRYSVFSAVGQYPLRVMGIGVDELLKGAADMRIHCLKQDIHQNPAMQRAALLHHHSIKGRNIADMFLFSPDLESVGKWYRQLMGESIGKEWNAQKTKRVWVGITPTVSVGSTDLHSMAQLYLGGPHDKFTTFVTVKKTNNLSVPRDNAYESLVPHIQGRKLSSLMQAIFQGVSIAYTKGGRSWCHVQLEEITAYQIGALLQMHMIEMMHLGRLMRVNPFDQPNVEAYKIETKNILARLKK